MVQKEVDASNQLKLELDDASARAFAIQRPILTHLNADTTWLLSLPYPKGAHIPACRSRFNILVDPWLTGPQSDVAGWFSTQWHQIKSSIQSIAELNHLLSEREILLETTQSVKSSPQLKKKLTTFVDACVISHEFTDHCHKATLLELDPQVPVWATTKAAELIRTWKHFDQVFDMEVFGKGTDWRKTSKPPLPSWLGLARLITPGDALYYHSAIVISFEILASFKAESVIYTPHGVEAGTFTSMLSANPPLQNLAFLHGLHDVSITLTKQLNLGAHNALKAQRLLHSRYWVGTHDEVKKGGGLIAPFLRRKAHTLLDALSNEAAKNENGRDSDQDQAISDPSYVDLGNGQSLVLDEDKILMPVGCLALEESTNTFGLNKRSEEAPLLPPAHYLRSNMSECEETMGRYDAKKFQFLTPWLILPF